MFPTASEIAFKIANGDTSAETVAEASLACIATRDADLNALSEVTRQDALNAARAVDAARAAGKPLGPLAGVPVTIKNNVDQAGAHNSGGVIAAKDVIATHDSPLVANLKRAGAVIVGRTNVPAFSFRWFTDSALHGRTLNPFGENLSSGGSSGGAAVSVAAGYVPLAHGNDIGGSIRHPALMNGVAGLRPTVGRIPSYVQTSQGMRALSSQLITAEGPIARCVADLRLGVNAMSQPDPRDPQHVPMPHIEPAHPVRKVGVMIGNADRETKIALKRAEHACQERGIEVEPVSLPYFEDARLLWQVLVIGNLAHHYLHAIETSSDKKLIHKVKTALSLQPLPDAGQMLDAWAQRLQIQRAWSDLFETHPVIILPVSNRHALKVDADQGSAPELEALFADQTPLLATAFTGVPGISLPMGLASDGAPTGIQLIARWWDEPRLLSTAEVLEAALPPMPSPKLN